MKNRLSAMAYGRYFLTALTALTLFVVSAGLSPTAAASETAKATTASKTTVFSQTNAGTAGLTLPGKPVGQPQVSLNEVPEEYLNVDQDATPLASTQESHAAIGSYETRTGIQTLIQIGSAEASHEYRFPLSLPAGATVQLVESGAIIVKDFHGEQLGGYSVPWAVDATGGHVPTRFRIENDALIQTVDFTPQAAFPVTADPNWWQSTIVAAATGAVAAAVAAIPGVGTAVAGAAAGCAGGALAASFDGADFWGAFWGCAGGGALGGWGRVIGNVVGNVIKRFR